MSIYNFSDFIMLESEQSGFPFHLSDVLVFILSKIDDPISKELLHLNSIKDFKPYTLIDTEFEDDYVTFVPGKLIYPHYDKYGEDDVKRRIAIKPPTPSSTVWWTGRNPIRIGRLVNNLFPGKFSSHEVEVFVNKFKSKNQKIANKFEIWNNIPEAYDTSNYSNKYGESNQLWNSCMNDPDDGILDFYVHNDQVVNCLVLMEEELDANGEITNKIIGRALIWQTSAGEFMDRFYYIHDKDYYKFIDYAKENNIIYKSKNQSGEHIEFVNKDIQTWYKITIDIKYAIETYYRLPFMDTFCFGKGKKLMNYRDPSRSYIKLNGTEGEFEIYREDDSDWR